MLYYVIYVYSIYYIYIYIYIYMYDPPYVSSEGFWGADLYAADFEHKAPSALGARILHFPGAILS